MINNIGINLLNCINDKNDNISKNKFLLLLSEYKDILKKNENDIISAKILYNINFEQPRIELDNNYNTYYNKREELYNIWKDTNELNDLINLVNLSQPDYKLIPDIYTYTFNQKNKKPIIKKDKIEEEPVIKKNEIKKEPVIKKNEIKKEPVKKKNEIKKEPIKKKDEIKEEPVKKEKKCPEGKVLNPNTGRCIDKNSVLAKKLGLVKK